MSKIRFIKNKIKFNINKDELEKDNELEKNSDIEKENEEKEEGSVGSETESSSREEGVSEVKRRYRTINDNGDIRERKIENIVIRDMNWKTKKERLQEVCKNIKNVVKSKQTKKVATTFLVLYVGFSAIDFLDAMNRKIVLDVNGQEISWNISDVLNPNEYEYELFRNEELLKTTKARKFIESISMDKEAPGKVGDIKIDKNDEMYVFTWKDAYDKGTIVDYQVNAISKGFGMKYASRVLEAEIASGVEKYIIMLDGKKYESVIPTFSIASNSLRYGSHELTVAAVDFSGNISKARSIKFKVDNTKFFIDDYKLATNNSDITNESYDIYVVQEYEVEKDGKIVAEKKETPISIGDYLHSYFRSQEVPMISNPRYIYESNLVNVTWEENSFGENNTQFYIKCKSKSGLKTYKSDKIDYTLGDFLPGYYYEVNKEPIYMVTKADSYTMDNNVNLDSMLFNKNEIYYFHVAASNEFGNLSKTKTLELDLTNFTSVNDKKDVVRSLLYRTKGLSGDTFRKITDDLYNVFALSTIKKLKDLDLKIVVTEQDINDYVLANHNVTIKNKEIFYVQKDNTIVYNAKTSLDLLIKEIVKVLDVSRENPISENAEFLSAYKSEMLTIQKDQMTAQDYLAEVVNIYINDKALLKSTSPKTYDFINSMYKVIMFI